MNTDLLRAGFESLPERLRNARPACCLVLGSGWGPAVPEMEPLESLDYARIPVLGAPGVEGHGKQLLLGRSADMECLVFLGRRHWYEGLGWEPVAFPVYLAARLGCGTLVLTNAAGGIRPDLEPGDLMVIDDHVNAMGANPLTGRHDPVWGARFPDQTEVYDARLRGLIDAAAREADLQPPAHGVYLAACGPTYETPAEVAAFLAMGADAVGMSTVPEAVLANAAGLRVAGLSCITNRAADRSQSPLSHAEVIARTREARPRMRSILSGILALLASGQRPPA